MFYKKSETQEFVRELKIGILNWPVWTITDRLIKLWILFFLCLESFLVFLFDLFSFSHLFTLRKALFKCLGWEISRDRAQRAGQTSQHSILSCWLCGEQKRLATMAYVYMPMAIYSLFSMSQRFPRELKTYTQKAHNSFFGNFVTLK